MFTYESEDQVIEAGERFERARYWQNVREIAEAALAEHPGDEETQHEAVWQSVDGSAWVIYTYRNLDVLRFTENDDAYEDFGDLPTGEGAYRVYQLLAFCAMKADVEDELARLRRELDDEA